MATNICNIDDREHPFSRKEKAWENPIGGSSTFAGNMSWSWENILTTPCILESGSSIAGKHESLTEKITLTAFNPLSPETRIEAESRN